MANIPEKPTLDGIEDRWSDHWEQTGVYRFDRTAERADVFSIDTPPPTVSGSIHMGTVFGYTQTDAIARHRRMSGTSVFFPIGWDDNGLATERRVQNFYGVRCDPSQPYDPGFQPPFRGDAPKGHQEIPISRPNFVDLCHELTATDEAVFEALFRRLGLSYDWSLKYETINDVSRRTSQQAFLRNLGRGEAYSAEAPTVWDVDDRTAVAQAEIEDRERPGAYHLLAFHLTDPPNAWRSPEVSGDDPVRHGGDEGASPAASSDRSPEVSGDLPIRHGGDEGASPAASSDVLIDTTRPELLVSCVALVAHPDDERYAPLIGTTVRTPLFGVEVPVVAHPLAQPDKGTGIAMVCTFGDTTDVTWWRELNLPTRSVIGRDGRFVTAEPSWLDSDEARANYATLAGLTVKQAQAKTVELLQDSGELHGDPRPITHPVKFYERGSRPLEIVTSRQWYIRNGGREQDRRDAFLGRGKELDWYPDHMRHRYDHWVEGLNGDWLISRQRFFGVPIPLWYALDADGVPDYDHPIVPGEDTLPMDPSSDVPPGFTDDQRGQPGGFVGDPDIMDTWATSSLTPQIAGRWVDDEDLWGRVFPMDIRPQGPEIIRTWLFSTVVRSHYEHGTLPWHSTTINGWILDPDRKKMSKSKGNVVTPAALFDRYGTDAVRYWAIAARPGVDTAFSEDQMKVGRRLATKLLNVTKFVLGILSHGGSAPVDPQTADQTPGGSAPVDPQTPDDLTVASVTDAVDLAMLARLDAVIADASAAFDGFDYARALERTESFFWWFCDDYVELVKGRAYGSRSPESRASALAALSTALDALTRLLAPTLPFATEEAWSWSHDTSVHAQSWPHPVGGASSDLDLDAVSEVLGRVRRTKTESKVSQRAAIDTLTVTGPAAVLDAVRTAAADLQDALTVAALELVDGPELGISATLAPTD